MMRFNNFTFAHLTCRIITSLNLIPRRGLDITSCTHGNFVRFGLRLTSLTIDIVMTYDLLKKKRGNLEMKLASVQNFFIVVFIYYENKTDRKKGGILSANCA